MTKKWIGLLLVVVMLLATLVWVGLAQTTADAPVASSKCRLQGAWVSSFAGGPWDKPLIMQETITPLDPAGNKLVYVMRLVNPDATFAFPFPPFTEAEYMSDLVGEAVRSGRDTYDFSLIGYAVANVDDDRGDIKYIWTVTGSLICVDDQNKTDNVFLAVYEASQDSDQDGFPDEGEVPVFCNGPSPFSAAKRVPQIPACEPPPE